MHSLFFHRYLRLMLLVIGLLTMLLLLGCSGGEKKPGPSLPATTGRVLLPINPVLTKGNLKVLSPGGLVAVGNDGTFSAREPDGGPALVTAVDQHGKLVMLGHVDTDNPSFNEISPKTTAEELLFFSTTAFMLPPGEWQRVYEILNAAPATTTLANVIAKRLAINPTALDDQDAEIKAALDAATALLVPPGSVPSSLSASATRQSMPAGKSLQSFDVVVSRATGASPVAVEVTSANPPGIMVSPSIDGLGIVVQNWFRIHREIFVYRTSTTDANNVTTPLSNWTPVAQNVFLPAVSGVTSFVGALYDYAADKTAWAPKSTDTIGLPLEPAGATKNTYKIFVVGAGTSTPFPADIKSQTALFPTIRDAQFNMFALEWLKEAIVPVIARFLPAKALAKMTDKPEKLITVALNMVNMCTSAGFDIHTDLLDGKMDAAWSDFFKGIVTNPDLRRAIFAGFYETLAIYGESIATSPEQWSDICAKVTAYLRITDSILTVTDVGKVILDMSRTYQVQEWDAKVTLPKVSISPKPASVALDESVTLHVNTGGGLGALGTLSYHYTCGPGSLSDSIGHTGQAFDSSKPDVTYTPALAAKNGDTDTVTVTVSINIHGTISEVGTDHATINISETPISLTPLNPTVAAGSSVSFSVQGLGTPHGSYEYLWSYSGDNFGHLDDGQGHTGTSLATTTNGITFAANANALNGATGTVQVTVLLHPTGGGAGYTRGTTTSNVTASHEPLTYTLVGDLGPPQFNPVAFLLQGRLKIYVNDTVVWDRMIIGETSFCAFTIKANPGDIVKAEFLAWAIFNSNYINDEKCILTPVYISGPGLSKTQLIGAYSFRPANLEPEVVLTGTITLPNP